MAKDKRIDMNPNELVNQESQKRIQQGGGSDGHSWELAVVEEVNIFAGQIPDVGSFFYLYKP